MRQYFILSGDLAQPVSYRVKENNIPVCWRLIDYIPVIKNSSSSDVGDYWPISITPVLSKVFEKIVSEK